MHTRHTLPPNCRKFWPRRYDLFKKHDEGIYMTAEMWYSVTPEKVAVLMARIIKQLVPEAHDILDICCGAGGNTIQFGKCFPRVGAIDINETNTYCTEHNCGIYGVGDNVYTITEDWRVLSRTRDWIPEDIMEKQKPFDFVFASPPWGGTSYDRDPEGFNLMTMEPLNLPELCMTIREFSDNFGVFLPKSSRRNQISEVAKMVLGEDGRARVIEIVADGYPKGIFVLFGDRAMVDIDYDGLFEENEEDWMPVEVEDD